jgi:hypothetical protein
MGNSISSYSYEEVPSITNFEQLSDKWTDSSCKASTSTAYQFDPTTSKCSLSATTLSEAEIGCAGLTGCIGFNYDGQKAEFVNSNGNSSSVSNLSSNLSSNSSNSSANNSSNNSANKFYILTNVPSEAKFYLGIILTLIILIIIVIIVGVAARKAGIAKGRRGDTSNNNSAKK